MSQATELGFWEQVVRHCLVASYVGNEEVEDDEAFEEKMNRLTKELGRQSAQRHELEKKINDNLKKIGYEL